MITHSLDQNSVPRRADGPRMLMVGEFGSSLPCPYFSRALRSHGWHVTELDYAHYFPKVGNDLVSKIAARFLFPRALTALRHAIIEQARANEVDAIFFSKAIGATSNMLKQFSNQSIRSICWYPDVSFEHSIVDENCFLNFDIFITTKDFHISYLDRIRNLACNILIDHGYCDDVHWQAQPIVAWDDRQFDIIFVGNHSAYKYSVMHELITARPQLRYLIIGHRWDTASWPSNATSVTVRTALTGDAMSRAFNSGRIAIAVHHGKDGNRHGWEDSVSARTFEIPACGTPMLHIAGDYLPTLFDVNTEVACFDGHDELVRQVDALLAAPEQAMAMAQRAYQRAVPHYGYLARGNAIAAAIASIDARFAHTCAPAVGALPQSIESARP